MTNRESRNLRELEAALGLLKLNGFHMNIYSVGRQIKKTRLQIRVLNRVFEISRFPSSKTIFDLALLINIHPKSIQKWFQNTRQTMKKKKGMVRGEGMTPDSDEYNIFDIPLPVLADIVEVEKRVLTRLNL